MKRLAFILFTLPMVVLVIGVAWLTLTEGGLNWVYLQLRDQPAFSLDAERVEGRLIGPIRVSELWFESAEGSLQADRLSLDIELWPLLLGEFGVQQVHVDGVQLILPASADDKPFEPDRFNLQLPLRRISIDDLTVSNLQITRGESEWSAQRLSSVLKIDGQQLRISAFELRMPGYQLSVQGEAALRDAIPVDLALDWRVQLASQPQIHGVGRIHGDLRKLRLQQSIQSPTPVVVDATVISPLSGMRWTADVRIADFRSSQWLLEGPTFRGTTNFRARGDLNSARVSGLMQADSADSGPLVADFDVEWGGSARLDIHQLRITSEQTDTSLEAQGWWRPGKAGGSLDLALKWSALRWPLRSEAALLSPSGEAHLQGVLDNYRFNLVTKSPWPGLQDATLNASGQGGRAGVRFERLELSALEGVARATGRLDWSAGLSWQAAVQAKNVNPRGLQPDWPGRLDFDLLQRGGYHDGRWHAETEIQRLQGVLREYPVGLRGRFSWRDQVLSITDAVFTSGDSRVQASGEINDQWQLSWRIDSPRLQELYPDLGGSVNAQGELTGTHTQPRIHATVKASGLAYQDDYRADSLDSEFNVAIFNLAELQGRIDIRGGVLAGRRLDLLRLNGTPSRVELKATAMDFKLDMAVVGNMQDGLWKGRLQNADIYSGTFKSWRLNAPVDLTVTETGQVDLATACWKNMAMATMCADFTGGQDAWKMALEVAEFPLQVLTPWLPTGMGVDSVVDGEANATFCSGRLNANANARLAAGEISYLMQNDEQETVQHQGGMLKIWTSSAGIAASAGLQLGDGDQIQAELTLPGADLLTLDADTQVLRGRVHGRMHRLAFLGEQIPEVHKLSGEASMDVKISGKLRQPSLDGRLSLVEGQFSIPRLGLTVTDIEVQANTDDLDRVQYRLLARSGEGDLAVDGFARRKSDGDWMSELSITGKDFEVSRIPEARIQASPDLKVVVHPYRVDFSGRIEIPYAHIEPRDFTTAARPSADVVIVGEEQKPARKWKVASRVQLVLGDRVHFSGFGLEGRLNGQVLAEETPGLPTRASGEISIIDGRYRAYGQRLSIEQGRLLFSGGPLTSPAVDARAIRKVGDITVGVRASGQIQQPVIELFSIPAMGQTDILSYLLLGRPLEKASDSDGAMMAKAAIALGLSGGDRLARSLRDRFGLDEMRVDSNDTGDQASLVIGRYLSPRLYVSYGIGLVEAFNTVVVRYSISERWQLKAESGEAHGADLIFTIER